MTARYSSVPLAVEHDVAGFDCGVPSLDAWLAEQALRAQRACTARTYVWTAAAEPRTVWAYFSLAPTEVVRDGVSGGQPAGGQLSRGQLSRGQPAGYSRVPGYLLARLAVHKDLRGCGLGSQLLVDALTRAAAAAEPGGGHLVVVDALDDAAAAFYRHHDFAPVRGNPRRLVLKIATIRSLLGAARPSDPSR